MRFLPRCIHAVFVLATVLLFGAVLFFVVGSVELGSATLDTAAKWAGVALPWVLLAFCAWGVWKKASYALLLPVIALSGGLIIYLVRDDPVRPKPPQLGAVVPANSPSYEAYRWFLKNDPHSRLAEIKKAPDLPRFPADHAKWPEFFAQNRTAFTRAWEGDTLGREWIAAMAKSAPEGIYPPPAESTDKAMLSYAAIRYSTGARMGYGQVLMLDEKFEEAAELLVPLLRGSYHLQRGGCLLVTQMVAVAIQRRTYAQLEILVASGKLSPASRAAVAAVLREAPPIPLVLSNAFLGEEAFSRTFMDEAKKNYGDVVKTLLPEDESKIPANRLLWRLFFNPNRSEKEYAEFLHEFTRLAQLRQLAAGESLAVGFVRPAMEWRIKNPVGLRLIQASLPSFTKVAEIFWKTDDQRLALLHQLEKP